MSDQPNNPAERGELASFPDKCPITRRPFFMVLEHPELGLVPTYGGPYDSYTIPHMEGQPDQLFHERELACHRYDHDLGSWHVDEEGIPLRIVHEDVLNELQDLREKTSAQPPAGDRAGNDVAPRWLTELEGVCAGLERETDAGWSPDARSHVRRLRVFLNMIKQEASCPKNIRPQPPAGVSLAGNHGGDLAHAALAGKYGNVLGPFLVFMEQELHANTGKGDRPGWLSMSRDKALLEIFYHLGKLQKAVKHDDTALIVEHSADLANMCMMLLDVCGGLPVAGSASGPREQPMPRLFQITEAPPTVEAVMADPATSFWLKDALQRALQRDPVDAAQDAQVLANILSKRADQLLASHGITNAPQ